MTRAAADYAAPVSAVARTRRWTGAAPARRLRLLTAVVGLAVLLGVGGVVVERARSQPAWIALSSGTVALGADGQVQEVPTGSGRVLPGTRVLRGPGSAERAAAEQAWLSAGSVPAVPELGGSDLVRAALLDLHVLSQTYGVPVAGWAGPWRYVWPRDSALAAAAFARTGHLDDAERIIDFLGRIQPESGVFQARYLPDGSGVPDDRGVQLDGTGWVLWATAQVADTLPPDQRADFARRHQVLIERSRAAALTAIEHRNGLPPASADYWEVRERRTTLATAALIRAGLESAARLESYIGDAAAAQRSADQAARLGATISDRFAADGYPRHLGGSAGSVDLGVAFLLPPFSATVDPQVLQAFRAAAAPMGRPAGGLAPGGSWRKDGVSWTTATSSYALAAAASGDRAEAVGRLRWLQAHRTAEGSLPEKVLANGQPAAVAPLAWTAAVVILTADTLQHAPRTVGPAPAALAVQIPAAR